uniref:Tyrosine kinase G-rich domain-containing protein n=1 Tax=Bosea sp. NBC_00436 TaxID=2969620 RepID=A0A9E8CKP2_9HYPH
MAAGAFFVLLKGATYTASTQFLVYVKEVQPGSELVVSLGRADLTQVENEIEIIRSRGTLAKVVSSLNLASDPEFVPAPTLPEQLVRWLAGRSQTAADESRSRQEIAIASLAKHISPQRIGTSHTILLNVTTSSSEKSTLIANEISQVMLQARGADQEGDRSPLLRERLQGLGPGIYVMTPALVPDKPNGPRRILIVLGAVFVGFLIGTALALLLDLQDKSIRTANQVERFGLECLGAIPWLSRRKPASANEPGSMRQRTTEGEFAPSPLLDQTLLRMAVAAEAAKARVVGIASPIAGDGATTVARHFAQTAARSQKVLLVEAGRNALSMPRPEAASPDPTAVGNAHLETRDGDLWHDDAGGPDVLTIAASPDGDGCANWWMHCGRKSLAAYDLIIVGLPPLEQGAAFHMAAQNIDGILLVMKWGGADAERIERAFAVSGAAPADFIGAVLNGVDSRMIGLFGDELWKAEATISARRRPFVMAMRMEPVAEPT